MNRAIEKRLRKAGLEPKTMSKEDLKEARRLYKAERKGKARMRPTEVLAYRKNSFKLKPITHRHFARYMEAYQRAKEHNHGEPGHTHT